MNNPRTLGIACALLAIAVTPLQAQEIAAAWLSQSGQQRAPSAGDRDYALSLARRLGGEPESVKAYTSSSSFQLLPPYKAVLIRVQLPRDQVVVMRLRTRSETEARTHFKFSIGLPAGDKQRTFKVRSGKHIMVLWSGEGAAAPAEAARRLLAAWGKKPLRAAALLVQPQRGSRVQFLGRLEPGATFHDTYRDVLVSARRADAERRPLGPNLEWRWRDTTQTEIEVMLGERVAMLVRELDDAALIGGVGERLAPLKREWRFFLDVLEQAKLLG